MYKNFLYTASPKERRIIFRWQIPWNILRWKILGENVELKYILAIAIALKAIAFKWEAIDYTICKNLTHSNMIV